MSKETETAPKLNLQQRIIKIMDEVGYVQKEKNKVNGQYRPVSRNSVVAAVRQSLIRHGVVVAPLGCDAVRYDQITYGDKNTKGFLGACVMQFVVFNADLPSENFVMNIPTVGIDSSDKGMGKAITYAEKQAFVILFHIETGDSEESQNQEPLPPPEKIDRIGAELQEELRALVAQIPNVTEASVAQACGPDLKFFHEIPIASFEQIKTRLTAAAARAQKASA